MSAGLIIFMAVSLLAILMLSRKQRKTAPYTGGEKVEPEKILHANFYQTLYRLFPRTYNFLERMHDEDLDNYLYIILLTSSLLFLLVMLPGWL